MNKVSTFLKSLTKKVKLIIIGVALVIVLLLITKNSISSSKTTLFITNFQEQSQLITGKLTFQGYTEYKDDGTILINRGDFTMLYTAEVAMGIEISEIDISKNDFTKKITIKLPSSEVLYVDIKGVPKYVDKQFAVFNFDKREDSAKAIDYAKKDIVKQLKKNGNIEGADEQAKNIIKGMFSEVIEKGYSLEFVSK